MHRYLLTALMAMLLSGCNVFDDDDDNAPPPDDGGMPPPMESVDFTGFVIDLVQNGTADDTEPVEINDIDFAFDDNDEPAAFDALFDSP